MVDSSWNLDIYGGDLDLNEVKHHLMGERISTDHLLSPSKVSFIEI